MKHTRNFQEDIVSNIESLIYDTITKNSPDLGNTFYLKHKVENFIEVLRHNILSFYFEDDLLLQLFKMLEYSYDYLNKIEETYSAHKLSA